MATLTEMTNKGMNDYTMNDRFITIAPQKIRTSLATEDKFKYTSNKYKRPDPLNLKPAWYRCGCYKRDSIDARCCGLCYVCCPKKTLDEQSNCCPNDFGMYWDSGYVQTTAGYGKQADNDEKNGICCWFCFPLKFGLFFPCCVGSIGNGCINHMRDTNVNYFF